MHQYPMPSLKVELEIFCDVYTSEVVRAFGALTYKGNREIHNKK